MRIGICPGSFDPVTNGHIDIFERGSKLVDKLIVAVFENPVKKPLFTMAEREEMLRETTRHIPNIEVVSFHGLLNEYAIDHGATKYSYISSTGIRELACFGGKLDDMVPDYVEKKLKVKFADKYNA